jgi:hypothetical protein
MKKIALFFVVILYISCQDQTKTSPNNFKIGKFKTVLEDESATSFATRNDSIQVETYNEQKDTFYITWLSNFEYILLKKHPKTMLDSTPFHVKITGLKKDSYEFNAYYKGSKFKQKGTAFKLQ